MKLTIKINGTDISAFGLKPLDGTLDNLMKPAEMKSLVYNENTAIDGSLAMTRNRKVKRRDVTLLFIISRASLLELTDAIDALVSMLAAGKNNSGVNEGRVEELDRTFRLVYSSVDKYSNFGIDGKATLSIKFVEPNPKNRS